MLSQSLFSHTLSAFVSFPFASYKVTSTLIWDYNAPWRLKCNMSEAWFFSLRLPAAAFFFRSTPLVKLGLGYRWVAPGCLMQCAQSEMKNLKTWKLLSKVIKILKELTCKTFFSVSDKPDNSLISREMSLASSFSLRMLIPNIFYLL